MIQFNLVCYRLGFIFLSSISLNKLPCSTRDKTLIQVTLQKGGVPAAPSGTATLLRLHPPYQPHLRRLPPLLVGPATSGAVDSGGVTGGVYKARERIHRGVADPRLLATPPSWSRVADSNPN